MQYCSAARGMWRYVEAGDTLEDDLDAAAADEGEIEETFCSDPPTVCPTTAYLSLWGMLRFGCGNGHLGLFYMLVSIVNRMYIVTFCCRWALLR